ncbi:uncharacterized protein L969DRAFT_90991 [Mixia osmundae IAM 14324]|uniref:U3 small nucleolar ribonucleoprotein protein IMP3 n=1 Tax=Mixia osmundae (strain CBS 9802 / IAM 14324 / JCM 22182 / KY 12970) TaxID=764103 RepID=G7DV25_MIXOS|nr:uncharacterized protein L969DRAFT_90991 [Mixia osmundae IAM 14324]KEI36348.1 hypothetical protein L969DRAFT_90991 [Mixia osmundae IAM 14324]GAA94435.1 hypothetical protein E5Q_01087 [Mixia osmundae IAM 14324]
MRQLKHHEKKLLKKVDFLQWKQDSTLREAKVMRTYFIQRREDYQSYNRLCGSIRQLAHRLSQLDPRDPFRGKHEALLLSKLYDMGILGSESKMSDVENKITVSAMCRRRIGVVMCRLKMSQTVKMAVQYVEQGHVRVGPETVTDPAFLVTRNMEDFVTWVDTSKLKRTVMSYNDELDDYDLL